MKLELDLPEQVVANLEDIANVMNCTVSQVVQAQIKLISSTESMRYLETQMNSEE